MNKDKKIFYVLHGQNVLVIKSFEDSKSSTFKYAVPLDHDNQIPILLDVDGDFSSYDIIEEESSNTVIKFDIPPMQKDERITIKLDYWVLTKNKNYKKLPKKIRIPISKELIINEQKWLASTASIRSKNIFIKVMARIIQGFSNDLLWFVKKVMYWSAYHGFIFNFMKKFFVTYPVLQKLFLSNSFGYKLEDSLSSLFFGSLCAGAANLQVALLRARGIPARIIISTSLFYGKNKWMDSQHYFVEFFCPGFGWVRAQSGCMPYPSKRSIILRIITPKEENIAGNGLSKHGGAPKWFWFDNKNIFFGIPHKYVSYKLPKSKTIGFPAVKGWVVKRLCVPNESVKDICSITKEIWSINKKYPSSKNFSNCRNAIDSLIKSDYDEYITKMQEIKNA